MGPKPSRIWSQLECYHQERDQPQAEPDQRQTPKPMEPVRVVCWYIHCDIGNGCGKITIGLRQRKADSAISRRVRVSAPLVWELAV